MKFDLHAQTVHSGMWTIPYARPHLDVYNREEYDHAEPQRQRRHFPALFALPRERKLFVSVNHVYSSLTGPRGETDFGLFARFFRAVEVLNGRMPGASNAAANFASRKRTLAASDAYTIGPSASAYTSVAAAPSKQELLDCLSRRRAIACKEPGNCWRLAAPAAIPVAGTIESGATL